LQPPRRYSLRFGGSKNVVRQPAAYFLVRSSVVPDREEMPVAGVENVH
jgi:hypothetical protein